MIVKIILLVFWILEALSFGKQDAHLYHDRMTSTNPDKENIHYLFAIDRFVLLVLISWVHFISHSVLNTGVFASSLMLLYSFFHNSAYYATRNSLDKKVYPKKWLDSSTTSESFLEFNLISRVFMAIVGAIGIFSTFTFK